MPSLPELIQSLLSPAAYSESTASVELIQTEISFVFLTDRFAYKVKKPVKYDYLDFSTPEKRRYFCEREVILNRRLCPDVYLGVVPVTREDGGFRMGGDGAAIDYAVKMVRLPSGGMMNVMLNEGRVTTGDVERIALKLAAFHRGAATGPGVDPFGSIDAIKKNSDENFTETEKYIGATLSREAFDDIKKFTNGFIERNLTLFERRVKEGRIRDGHGDLHARNICIADDIYIYDCIEFNDRFRCGDVASEVAFLAMDLDHYGRADLGRAFVKAYADASGDLELLSLLDFYKCYRAYVRGKVASFELEDPFVDEAEKARVKESAGRYFDLARSYAAVGPLLVITVGLTGTGKSTLAVSLARRLGATVISSDSVRKALAGVPPSEHRYEDFGGGIYTPDFTQRTYRALFDGAGEILRAGGRVILDASFMRRDERLRAKAIAARYGARFFVIETGLVEEELKKRLADRSVKGTISDGRWEIYLKQKGVFEAVNEVSTDDHFVVDSLNRAEENAKIAVSRIFNRL